MKAMGLRTFVLCASVVFSAVLFFSYSSYAREAGQVVKGDDGGSGKIDMDMDLNSIKSETVRERIKKFRSIIRREKTRAAKIKKALSLMKDPKSPYKKDAVLFLAEVRAEGVLDDMYKAAKKDIELRGHVVLAYRKMNDPRAVPYLIGLMHDKNENVSRSAAETIQVLTGLDLGFDETAGKEEKERIIKKYTEWWRAHKKEILSRKKDPEAEKEAEEMWRKYGEPYLNR